jgi:hypothetical protein
MMEQKKIDARDDDSDAADNKNRVLFNVDASP